MSDIIVGVRLASQILESGFEREITADISYFNLQDDIANFHGLLEQLHSALQDAQRRYFSSRHATGNQPHEPLSPELEDERRTLVGDFVATLRSCDTFLNRSRNLGTELARSHIRSKASNVQGPRVDSLRNQLHLHARKIGLILPCLSNDLLFKPTVEDFEAAWNLFIVGSRPIGHRVADRLSRSFAKDRHLYLSIEGAFDAILLSLDGSTRGTNPGSEQYLSFIKALWLSDRMNTHPAYRSIRSGVYYQYAMNHVEQMLEMQTHRMVPYHDDELMQLPDSRFQIWPRDDVPPLPPPKDHPNENYQQQFAFDLAHATEEQVAQIPLASRTYLEPKSLIVFKRSDHQYRLVTSRYHESSSGNKTFTQQSISANDDRLIPRYAQLDATGNAVQVGIFSQREETLFTFNTIHDMHGFQAALTGYDVSHDQDGIRCQFSDEAASLDCRGRVQLWQEPIAARPIDDVPSSAGSSTIGRRPAVSGRSGSLLGSVAPSVATTHTVHQTEGGYEADSIKEATLTIFTELQDRKKRRRLAIVSVELDTDIHIDPEECRCSKDYDSCSKLVLTKGKKRRMAVHTLYTESDASGQPNTNTFDLLPFRIPRHPNFRNLESKQTEYLVLKFSNLAEKRTFDEELRLRFQVRDAQIQNQADFAKHLRHREVARPRKQDPPPPYRSLSLTPSIASVAPKIGVLDPGPNLVDAMRDVKITRTTGYEDRSSEILTLVEVDGSTPLVEAMGDMKSAKSTGSEYWSSERTTLVEVDGSRPLVEMDTAPKHPVADMSKKHRRGDTFAELPAAIPWFPT